jgi:predicted NBD/HSP70 family sugar kinase
MQNKVDPVRMREVNRAILLDVLRSGGQLSRSDVARQTKLAKPTVSAIIEQLISEGVVEETGLGEAMANGGRRPRLLQYNGTAESYIGVQIGVNRTTVALADGRGTILATTSGRTSPSSPARTVAEVHRLAQKLARSARVPWSRVQAACVTVPGLVDPRGGVCVLAPNLHWEDVPLRELCETTLGIPVSLENTTRAAAVAEGRLGAAVGCRSFVWVYAGTGIGAGAVIDGSLFYGHQGFGGEIGHCPVADNTLQCGCGRYGCLETVASTAAITRDALDAIARGEPTTLSAAGKEVDAESVALAASQGDALSVRLITTAGDHLGRGISYLLNVLNPEKAIIGGPLAMAGPLFLDAVRSSVASHALSQVCVEIVPTTVDGHAEVQGAIFIAMGASSPKRATVA